MAYLNLPDADVEHLLLAENYIAGRTPDFIFRTRWIDFPMGPVADVADGDLTTVGDLLNGYIFDVSDPSKLAEPMTNLVLRFTGLVKVTFEDEMRIRENFGPPIWMDFGSYGFDGFRTTIGGVTCYRVLNANELGPWYNFGPSIEVLGLYPVEVVYFNNFDPDGSKGAPRGGFELHSWHGSEYAWPAGENIVHDVFGPMTLAPPWPIYQPGDELPMEQGDFDSDADIDLEDYQWLQNCFGSAIFLAAGCDSFDFDVDADVDRSDANALTQLVDDPGH